MSTSSSTYGPSGQRGGVADHGGRGGGVGAAVQHDAAAHVGQLAVPGGAVLVPQGGRVPVHVAEEGLEAVVDHLDRLAGAQRQQAGVDLHRQVLAAAERAADPGERHADLGTPAGRAPARSAAGRQWSHWVATYRSTPPSSAGTASPDSGPRNAWSCMPELVSAADHDVGPAGGRGHVTADDRLAVHDVGVRHVAGVVVVAVRVHQRRVRGERGGLVGARPAAARSRPRSSRRPAGRSPGGRRPPARPARRGSGPRRRRAPGCPANSSP